MAERVWSEKELVRRANRRLAVLQHAEEISGVLLPVVDAVQSGDVLEVFPQREIVVEGRLVGHVTQRRSCVHGTGCMTRDGRGPR